MPHVIYLHSALTQRRIPARDDAERRRMLSFQRIDVLIAMGVAGRDQHVDAGDRRVAVPRLRPRRRRHDRGRARRVRRRSSGPGAALAFALALLASGFAASSVGTYAGQVVMQGFINRTIPLILRRAVTMAPALVVLGIGVDPSRALVISQVVLSFGIPFALVPLVLLTRRRDDHGRAGQPTAHDGARVHRGGPDHRPQRLSARSDVRLGSLDSNGAREDDSPAMAAHAIRMSPASPRRRRWPARMLGLLATCRAARQRRRDRDRW